VTQAKSSHLSFILKSLITEQRAGSRQVRLHPHHVGDLVTERTWGLKISRKRTCEHPRPLDSAMCVLVDRKFKPLPRLYRASPEFTSIPLIWLAYRNHAPRRSKSGVYAEVVWRKCGEGITEERQSHLDTSTTPVGPLLPQYVHLLVYMRV